MVVLAHVITVLSLVSSAAGSIVAVLRHRAGPKERVADVSLSWATLRGFHVNLSHRIGLLLCGLRESAFDETVGLSVTDKRWQQLCR